MEYKLKPLAYNGLKGQIGEQLARSFIRDRLVPKLIEEEEWDHVVLSRNDYKKHGWTWNTKLFNYDYFREDFIVYGFYANNKLLAKYASAVAILEQNHCTPDGLLLKLRETRGKKRLNKNTFSSITKLRVGNSKKHGSMLELPVVGGDLEIVEIKCGRDAKLMEKQKKTYNDLIAKEVSLRMINVRIVSFDLNRFLVEEHRHERFL
ncbi:MAG: hypothetical protein PVF96_05920 [Candidatus Bathyarchaeota archaeon]